MWLGGVVGSTAGGFREGPRRYRVRFPFPSPWLWLLKKVEGMMNGLTAIEFELMVGAPGGWRERQYWPLGTTVAPNYGAPYGSGEELLALDTTIRGSMDDPPIR